MQDFTRRAFDRGARNYHEGAVTQSVVAANVVNKVLAAWKDYAGETCCPNRILDIGCGTGFVIQALLEAYPSADIYALDNAPHMLSKLRKNAPSAIPILADAASMPFHSSLKFDLIVSSMCLQWLANPFAALQYWRSHLSPHGALCVSLPVEGTFAEWRKRCQETGRACNLNRLLPLDFASHHGSYKTFAQSIEQPFDNSAQFISHLVRTGVFARNKARDKTVVRNIEHPLNKEPITVTWNILYIVAQNKRMSPGL